MELPYFEGVVPAGFGSLQDGNIAQKLDLHTHLIKHPAATFYIRVEGLSMKDAGIHPGDLLIVDRAIIAKDRHIVLAVVNGEFTVKRLKVENDRVFLEPENEAFVSLEITKDCDFRIWGVVTYVVHACTR